MVTNQVYGDVTATWFLQEFMFASTGSISVTNHSNLNIKHCCAPVVHPVTDKIITQSKNLQAVIILRKLWSRAWRKEIGNMAQGDELTRTQGNNFIFVMSHEEIGRIQRDIRRFYT